MQDSTTMKIRKVGESDSTQDGQPSSQGASASMAAATVVVVAETTSLHQQQQHQQLESVPPATSASTTSGISQAAPSFQVPMSSKERAELSPQPSSKEDLGGGEAMEHNIAGEEEEDEGAARKTVGLPCSSEIQSEEMGGFNVDSTEEVMIVDRGAGEASPETSETRAGLMAGKEEGEVEVEHEETREELEERQEEATMEPADTTQEGQDKVLSFFRYWLYVLIFDALCCTSSQ